MERKSYEGWLEVDSERSFRRAKERASMNKKRAQKMMNLARTRGIHSGECRWSIDRTYLENRSDEDVEAVAFNGFCFILDRQTMNCITLFSLPKDFGRKKTYYTEEHRKSKFIRIEIAYY